MCSLFIRKYGTVVCRVSRGWRHSNDLPQGPGNKFIGEDKLVSNVKMMLEVIESRAKNDKKEESECEGVSLEPQKKLIKVRW